MTWTITKDADGLCVREFIKRELQLSTKLLRHLKYKSNGICVNGVQQTVRFVLHNGDLLSLAIEDRETAEKLIPMDLPLTILYEDDDLVVPSKPADMPTHPSCDHYNDTVANALAYRYANIGVPFVFRPINRLDRNTSGLLLIARNRLAAGRLTDSMQSGKIQKSYLAILDGEMTVGKEGEINAPLHRTEKSIILREVCAPNAPDADPSLTTYRVLAAGNGHTLVEARPVTGRTHQLRVHFSYIGHPITGDDLYGTPSPYISRHALHARSLSFPHPTNHQMMTFTAPLPSDFQTLLHHCFPSLRIASRKEYL